MNQISSLLIRQVLLLLLIFALGWVLFGTLHPFLPALLGAYTLYVLLRRSMVFLTAQWRWPKTVAALALILLAIVVIGTPVHFLVQLVQARVIETMQHTADLRLSLETLVHRLEGQYSVSVMTPDNLKDLAGWLANQVRDLVTATLEGISTALLAVFILFFMLIHQETMENAFSNWLPIRLENVADFKGELNSLVFSNAVGIPVMGIIQGLAGLPVYWLAGVQDVWLWFAITCISGMLPILGVALAYVPMSLLMVANGMPLKGVLLFIYGFTVIGSVDNIGRMWLQKKLGDIHPLVTLFGVIAGLKLFGFIGFVFGPILIAVFLLLIRIYSKEFGKAVPQSP